MSTKHSLAAAEFLKDRGKALWHDQTLWMVRQKRDRMSRSLPEWDGKNLAVHGGSQGGLQALAATAFDPAVTVGLFNAPAGCDQLGVLIGRAPSWPGAVSFHPVSPEANRCAALFDGVSLARRSHAKAWFTVGFSDPAAVPSSVYAAFNAYGGTEKEIMAKFFSGVNKLAALSLSIGYPTLASLPHSLNNAFRKMVAIVIAEGMTYSFEKAEPYKAFLADPSAFIVAAPAAAAETAAPAEEKQEEEEEEEEDIDMSGGGLFGDDDDDW